eukprot:2217487-Lingulodinium_polyedra.AAC.1
MMRSSRPSATTAAHKSHASRPPCERHVWCSHGARDACDSRAGVPANGGLDRIIVQQQTGYGNGLRCKLDSG